MEQEHEMTNKEGCKQWVEPVQNNEQGRWDFNLITDSLRICLLNF